MRQLPFEYAYRNLGRSPARLFASLLGSALVVLLVLAAAGFVRGMQLTLTQPDALHENVLIFGAGSEESVERSQIDAGVPGLALRTVMQRYFQWHHTRADTLDKIEPENLRKATAMFAVMGYVLADMEGRL